MNQIMLLKQNEPLKVKPLLDVTMTVDLIGTTLAAFAKSTYLA